MHCLPTRYHSSFLPTRVGVHLADFIYEKRTDLPTKPGTLKESHDSIISICAGYARGQQCRSVCMCVCMCGLWNSFPRNSTVENKEDSPCSEQKRWKFKNTCSE